MNINIPAAVAVAAAFLGVGLAVGGVFLLAGAGWALITTAVPLLCVSGVIFRGLLRAATPQ